MEREMERLQAPPSLRMRVRDVLAIIADVLACYLFAVILRPQLSIELALARIRSIEQQQQQQEPELPPIMAFLIGEHIVLLDPRWWHLWVALLLHAKDCTASECPCILYPDCQRYQQQWTHLRSCREMGCQLPECARIKALLNHYEICADHSECDLCDNVNVDLYVWKLLTQFRSEEGLELSDEKIYEYLFFMD